MKNSIKALAVLSALGFSLPAFAAVLEADGLGTQWLGTPVWTPEPNPNPMSTATVAEGNWGSTGGAGNLGGIAQSFKLAAGGQLSRIQMMVSGGVQSFNIYLYDRGNGSSWTPVTSDSFNPGSLTDMFTSGLAFTYNAGAAGAGSLLTLDFSGADAVTLNANELYSFVVEPTSGSSGAMKWWRTGVTSFTAGQGYKINQFTTGQYGAFNGAVRDFAMAIDVVAVPEPASLALLGLGTAALLIRARKH